jgi:hypothetical protein
MLFVHDTGGASGHAERLGNDIVISLGNGFGGTVSGHPGSTGTTKEEGGTVMHEIGHNLNLLHGGPYALTSTAFAGIPIADASINCKPNYPSVMSYGKQMPIGLAGNWALEFSFGLHPSLNESSLTDGSLIGPVDARQIRWGNPGMSPATLTDLSSDPIDWGNNGGAGPSPFSQDINNLGVVGCNTARIDTQTFHDHNDWANLDLKFRLTPSGTFDAAHSELEAEVNSDQAIQAYIENAGWSEDITTPAKFGAVLNDNRDVIPIKFPVVDKTNSTEIISNLASVIQIHYKICVDDKVECHDANTGLVRSGILSNATLGEPPCNFDSEGGFYQCDYREIEVGTHYLDAYFEDPVDSTKLTGPLIANEEDRGGNHITQHLKGQDKHWHTIWFKVQ